MRTKHKRERERKRKEKDKMHKEMLYHYNCAILFDYPVIYIFELGKEEEEKNIITNPI